MPEVIMPRLSDTMEEGELTRWLKNVGDEVHKGDVLAEIETDKATMDLEAFENGVLEQQLVAAGTVVPIGQVVAVIGDGSGTSAPSAGAAPEASAQAVAAEGAAEETASGAAQAPAEGEPAGGSGASAEGQAAQAEDADARPEAKPAAGPTPAASDVLRASPLARKIARDHGIDLAAVVGTGPGGRVVRADIEEAIAAGSSAPAKAEPAATAPDVVEVPLNRNRKVTAKRLTESQAVPHYFLTNVVDVDRLIAFRREINESLAATGVKVSVNDLIVRAAALALRQHPEVNASWGEDKILRHGRINIGVAVATDAGLLVPVVTDVDRKPLSEIAPEIVALAGRAREGKLSLPEMSGSTFSISNLGMFGIDEFTAMLNPPGAAILAVGAASPVPALREGALVEVMRMKITLTVDHRVVDGATGAAFLRDLKGILEQPVRIVL
jgi:pyruvate dehydrogenase E2 component (dihydrolipoamide acetyltransferase)